MKNAPFLCIGHFFRSLYVVKTFFTKWDIFSFRSFGNPAQTTPSSRRQTQQESHSQGVGVETQFYLLYPGLVLSESGGWWWWW